MDCSKIPFFKHIYMKEKGDNKILKKIDGIICMAKDNDLIESYPTIDILELINMEFEKVILLLHSLPGTDENKRNPKK